ncbi:hypothetical protein AYI69_g7664 [Smittium culicis]|uniref:Paf1 complex subunit Cdc73 N-terminal domain-containing protein n=1 Tax=Smittium culicis TaxID=133412 RepID=A0A1R1XQF8_9FUNG|nr:hypothetical protein AYI69_g7664 [Smittium culicis]
MVNDSPKTPETSADPLEELKLSIKNKYPHILLDENKNIVTDFEKCKFIKLGENSIFDKDTPTNYYYGSSKNDNYSLISVLFFWLNIETEYYNYLKRAQKEKINAITFTYKTDIVEYLTGKKDKSPNIKSLQG